MSLIGKVQVTSGAGFIGGHISDALIGQDYIVTNLANLDKTVHVYASRARGVSTTVKKATDFLIPSHNKRIFKPVLSSKYRKGDIRHCYAYVYKENSLLGFCIKSIIKEDFLELDAWGKNSNWGEAGLFEKALKELEEEYYCR